jgi:tetratricopeptide (TPR) repeat protein
MFFRLVATIDIIPHMGLPVTRLIALGTAAAGVAVTGCAFGPVGGAVAGVVSGVLSNFFASLAQPGVDPPSPDTPESLIRNHDLRTLVGVAIRDCLLLETIDPVTSKKLAAGAIELWMSESSATDTTLQPLDEPSAAGYFTTDEINFDKQTALDEPTWRTFLTTLAAATKTGLSNTLRDRLALSLHKKLPQMLRAVVKQDFTGNTEANGRGFASLQLVMMGKLVAGVEELLKRDRPSDDVLEQIRKFNERVPLELARHDARVKDPRERAVVSKVLEQINLLRPHLDKRLNEIQRAVAAEGQQTRKEVRGVDRKVVYVLGGIALLVVMGLAGWTLLNQGQRRTSEAVATLMNRLDQNEQLIKQFLAERPLDSNNQPIIPQLTGDLKLRAEELIAKGNKRQRLVAAVAMNDFTTADRLQVELRAQFKAEREAEDFDLFTLEGDRWYRAGEFDLAVEPYEKAFQYQPLNMQAANNAAIARTFARLGDIAVHRTRAIEIYEKMLASQPAGSVDWAKVHNNLGNALLTQPSGSRSANLTRAINSYNAALTVFSKDVEPQYWGMTQNNLGLALANTPSGDKHANLRASIVAFQNALSVRTLGRHPNEWAMTQNNLGNSYTRLASDDIDVEVNAQNAIKSYEAALSVRTKSKLPVDWAQTQNNLGVAWEKVTSGNRSANLANSIAAYEAALTVRNRDSHPVDWAATHHNLAMSLAMLSDEAGQDRLALMRRAVGSCKASLSIRTTSAFPEEHGHTAQVLELLRSVYEAEASAGDLPFDEIAPAK